MARDDADAAEPTSSTWHRVAALDELADGRVTTVHGRSPQPGAHPLRRPLRRARQPLPAPGRPARRGLDREGLAALPVARLRLRPAHGHAAAGLHRRARVASRSRCATTASTSSVPDERAARAHRLRRDGRDDGRVGRHPRVRHGRALQPRVRRRDAPPGGGRATSRFIGIRHEGAAAFAASAYGKLTGRPAACFAIAGPGLDQPAHRPLRRQGRPRAGARHLGPGAVEGARPGRVPGRRPHRARSPTSPATRATVLPDSDHAELMTLALKHALRRARASPTSCCPTRCRCCPAPDVPGVGPERAGCADIDDRAARRPTLEQAAGAARRRPPAGHRRRPRRPLRHGRRCSRWPSALGAPVLTTFKAKGLISDHHPLGAGVLGRSGTPVASWLMNESDLLLVFGASFSNHTGIADYKPIVQVDFDPMALGRFHPVTVPVLGHVGVTAPAAARPRCRRRRDAVDQRADVAERWAIWRAEKARRLADDRGHGVGSAAVFDALTRLVPDDAVIAVDVGNNAYSFGRYFECARPVGADVGLPRLDRLRLPGGDGRVGGRARPPDRRGHRRRRLRPVPRRADHRGEVRHEHHPRAAQQLACSARSPRSSGPASSRCGRPSLHNPDFAEYARICGALGIRVERAAELDAALAPGARPRRPRARRGRRRQRPDLSDR